MAIPSKLTILTKKTVVEKVRGPGLHRAPVGPLRSQTGLLARDELSIP